MDVFAGVIRYLISSLSILGLIGNSYALFVFINFKDLRQNPSTPYLTCIAISDIIAILAELPSVANLFGLNIPTNRLSNTIRVYLTYSGFCFCSWSIVLATLERTIAVVWPLRYYKYHSRRISWSFIVGLFIVAFSYNLWIFAVADECDTLETIGNEAIASTISICGVQNTTTVYFPFMVLNTVDLGINFAIPVIIASVMNCIMCRQLYQAGMRRRSLLSQPVNGPVGDRTGRREIHSGSSKERRVTICLVMISVVFITLNLPLYLYDTLVNHGYSTQHDKIGLICYVLYISQFAINYLLYSVGFSCYLIPSCLRGSPTHLTVHL